MKTILRVLISVNLLTAAGAWAQNSSNTSSSGYANSMEPSSSVTVSRTRAVQAAAYSGNAGTLTDLIGTLQRGPSAVFVVPAADMPLPDLLTVNEDLTVMARIFNHALDQANLGDQDGGPFSYSFPGLSTGRGAQMAPNLYLAGYGALFTLSVDFPLSPVPEDEETAPQEKQTDTDPVWQEMRENLFEPERTSRQTGRTIEDQIQQYNAGKVETLKATLIGALKHAANIRALKPEEAVVVTVMGPTIQRQLHSIKSIPGTDDFEILDDQGPGRMTKEQITKETQLTAPTVLMIRAKAADIDAFSKGQLNLEQFHEGVTISAYPYLGRMVNSAASTTSIFIGSRGRLRR